MESEGNKKILTIQRGRELGAHPSDEMGCQESVLYSAYCQAIQATKEIVKQTSRFHCCCKPGTGGSLGNQAVLSNCLFSYSNNIIAFSAPRGGGKTHTMLSFARILQDKKYADEELKDINFYTIPPICPSILEKGQNALHIILSRLYSYAEEELFHQQTKRFFFFFEELERKLYGAFHRCLLGLNGVKFPAKEPVDDFSALQVTGDGIALQQHFYELIQNILAIVTGNGTPRDSYLVLQLDDTDSQIDRSYEVFEDIRKYLQIPNLIILMSVDMELMLDVVLEKYLGQFSNLSQSRLGVGPKTEDMERELSRICQKYIDKLIPPSHLVQIISLEKCLESYGECLELRYCYDDKKVVFPWLEGKQWSVEITILMLIFQKTGVVFAKPNTYIHNIVPTTYRGLNQLLFLLSTMEDVPEMTADGTSNGAAIDTVDGFVQALSRQIPVLARNLELFSNYFINSWISAKIKRADDRAFLRELQQIAPKYRVAVVLDYLAQRYPPENDTSQADAHSNPACVYNAQDHSVEIVLPFSVQQNSPKNGIGQDNRGNNSLRKSRKPRYILMETLIQKLIKKYNTHEDFFLFFAIHTIFTLESHRTVLRKKREGILNYEYGSNRVLAFDYDPHSTGMPETYLLDEQLQRTKLYINGGKIPVKSKEPSYRFQKFISREAVQDGYKFIWNCLVCEDEFGEPMLNFANFITLLLRLGAVQLRVGMVATAKQQLELQRRVYQMQEAALLIAANWDVQYRLRQLKQLEFDFAEATDYPAQDQLARLYRGFDEILCAISGGTMANYIGTLRSITDLPFNFGDTSDYVLPWGIAVAYYYYKGGDRKARSGDSFAIHPGIDLYIMLSEIIGKNNWNRHLVPIEQDEETSSSTESKSGGEKQGSEADQGSSAEALKNVENSAFPGADETRSNEG